MKTLSLVLTAVLVAAVPTWAADTQKCDACSGCCSETGSTHLRVGYEKISNALAADNLGDAQAAAAELVCCLNCEDHADLAATVQAFSKATAIADARTAFKAISAAMIPLVEHSGAHFVMTCPMAKADWIQTSAAVANPYFGSQMLRCGSIKATVADSH